MKNVKKLCLAAALGAVVMGGTLLQSTATYAATYEVGANKMTIEQAVSKAASGDVINITGTVVSKSTLNVKSGVTISGKLGKGKIDFNGNKGKGIVLGKGVTKASVTDLEICNAYDNGVYIEGNNNSLTNLEIHNNNDAGVQLSNGAAYNTITKVHSYLNCDQYGKTDPKKRGENADGFAVKLHSGEGNKLIGCVSEKNADDGYDLYAAHGAVTFEDCSAIDNGLFVTAKGEKILGDGNGFKVGGVDNKTKGVKAHMDPLTHTLTNCIATGNLGAGFDRNNQNGVVTMTNCTASNNALGNYRFPASGTPSALVKDKVIKSNEKVTFANAIIDSCTSTGNGDKQNNLSGVTFKGTCTGFSTRK